MNVTKIDLIKIIRAGYDNINLTMSKQIADSYERVHGLFIHNVDALILLLKVSGQISRGEIVIEDSKFYRNCPPPPMSDTELWSNR